MNSGIAELSKNKHVPRQLDSLLHQFLDQNRKVRISCFVVGDKRSGKTTGVLSYLSNNPPVARKGKNELTSVVYAKAPGLGGVKNLLQELQLAVTGIAEQGNPDRLQRRLLKSLEFFGVETLVIDNSDLLIKKTSQPAEGHIPDNLQIALCSIVEAPVQVVLVGSEALIDVVRSGKIIGGLFPDAFTMIPLNLTTLKVALEKWQEQVFTPLSLHLSIEWFTTEYLEVLLVAIKGQLGHLDPFLRKAAIIASDRGREEITIDILQELCSYRVWM